MNLSQEAENQAPSPKRSFTKGNTLKEAVISDHVSFAANSILDRKIYILKYYECWKIGYQILKSNPKLCVPKAWKRILDGKPWKILLNVKS